MTLEQMLSRDEIKCVAARSFGNTDEKTFRFNRPQSIERGLGFLELLFSILVALKCPGALLHCDIICDIKSTYVCYCAYILSDTLSAFICIYLYLYPLDTLTSTSLE